MAASDAPALHGPTATHAVTNQPPPLTGRNLFTDNVPLVEGLEREGGGWAAERAAEVGAFWGGDPLEWGRLANEHPPQLRTHDRYGHRIDDVEFHPAWHLLMARGVHDEMHALPWNEPRAGAHVARAAITMSGTQAEAGFGCPMTMTFAAVPALRATPAIAAEWVPRLTATGYDGRLRPATDKPGAICGMAMTEKQGGSDVRANTTTTVPIGAESGAGAEYAITGHKWFCSAPTSDLFLMLAQAPEGLSCFAVPRFLPDGARNAGFQLQRLKDKLGNRSNASSEIELRDAYGRLLGEPGRGVPTIIEMVQHTRLDCVVGAAAGMRAAVAQAIWHTLHRSAFGRPLAEQPAMAAVLADLAIESEAATALSLRLCRAYDEAPDDARARTFARVATAIAKYHVCKRVPNHAFEALECLGGSGYIEESGMPRLYREAPLSSIWEGSGNVMALDVLRALGHEPDARDVLLDELTLAAGGERRYDAFVAALRQDLAAADPAGGEAGARQLAERLALALQAGLLLRHAPDEVAGAFVAARLGDQAGHHYGTLPADTACAPIIDRHAPRAARRR